MLVAMNKVDPELLDEIRDYFDRLDVNNTGELSKDDLIVMVRRKMKNPRRKLELHAYKQHLIEISHQARNCEKEENRLGKWFDKSLAFMGFRPGHLPSD